MVNAFAYFDIDSLGVETSGLSNGRIGLCPLANSVLWFITFSLITYFIFGMSEAAVLKRKLPDTINEFNSSSE